MPVSAWRMRLSALLWSVVLSCPQLDCLTTRITERSERPSCEAPLMDLDRRLKHSRIVLPDCYCFVWPTPANICWSFCFWGKMILLDDRTLCLYPFGIWLGNLPLEILLCLSFPQVYVLPYNGTAHWATSTMRDTWQVVPVPHPIDGCHFTLRNCRECSDCQCFDQPGQCFLLQLSSNTGQGLIAFSVGVLRSREFSCESPSTILSCR